MPQRRRGPPSLKTACVSAGRHDTLSHLLCCLLCPACLYDPTDTLLNNLCNSLQPMGKLLLKSYSVMMLFYLTTGVAMTVLHECRFSCSDITAAV